MSFSDWEFFKSGSTVNHYIDQASPIGLNGALRVNTIGTGDRVANWKVTDASTLNHGFIHGRIRSLIQVESYTAGFSVGLACMQSVDNVTTLGDAYACIMRSNDVGLVSFRIEIVKFTGGILSAPVILDASLDGQSSLGSTFALEMEWNATSGTQTDFTVRFADGALDFTTLVTALSFSDVSSPFITTMGEGAMVKVLTTGSEQVSLLYDSTEIYEIIP